MDYEINETEARKAMSCLSMRDYKEGSETEAWENSVRHCFELAKEAKERVSDDRHEYIDYLCNKYSRKLAQWTNKEFRIQLMCQSVLVCGAGNFPTAKKERQIESMGRHYKELDVIESIISKIKCIGISKEIIKSSDENVLEMLQDKIDALTEKQNEMKEANLYYRKNGNLEGFYKIKADDLDAVEIYGIPYPRFMLTNNNAKIKQAAQRFNSISVVKERGNIEVDFKYFKAVENTEIMRLQLFFEGKPCEKTRDILKNNGFKWSPKLKSWQRQLNNNSRFSFKVVKKEIYNLHEC